MVLRGNQCREPISQSLKLATSLLRRGASPRYHTKKDNEDHTSDHHSCHYFLHINADGSECDELFIGGSARSGSMARRMCRKWRIGRHLSCESGKPAGVVLFGMQPSGGRVPKQG